MKTLNLKRYKKIYLTGGSGTGKTTLAKQLSKLLKITHYRTDRMTYTRNFSRRYSEKEKEKKIKAIANKKKWIIEGVHYEDWIKPAFKKADLVILLNLSKRITLWRVYKRSKDLIKGKTNHTYKDMFYLLKKTYKHKNKKHLELIKYHNKKYLILKTPKQVRDLLEELK
jgi:shikimate kinase